MKTKLFFGILLTVCIIIITFVFSQFYPGGMIAYWKFDEGEGTIAYDSVDGNHVGISSCTWDSGQVNGALRFYGSYTGFIKLPDMGTSFGGRGVFSVEAWINPEDGLRHNYFFCLGDGVNPSRGLNIGYQANTLCYRGISGQGIASTTIDLNVWHHIALTYDGTYAKVYQDGVEVISKMDANPIAANPDLWIGWPDAYYIFTGRVDEYAIYTRLLTEEEIQQHYQNGLNGLGYEVECIPLPAGMVSWWPGDGDADDIFDGNHGMLMNGSTFAEGMVAQAFSFDGVDDYVEIPDSPALDIVGTDFTIDFWLKTTDLEAMYVKKYPRYGGPGWALGQTVGNLHSQLSFWDAYTWRHSGVSVTMGSWVHIAIVGRISTSQLSWYINGIGVSVTPFSPIQDSVAPIYLGTEVPGGSLHLDGLLDEVEIFNRALSEEEIWAIYQAGSAGKCKYLTVSIDIKPGSYPNSINLGSNGNVPVAIFSTADFDATTVDPLTVTLAGASVRIKGKGTPQASVSDLDGDGLLDMIVHVDTTALQLTGSDTKAILEGETFDGRKIRGEDTVRVIY